MAWGLTASTTNELAGALAAAEFGETVVFRSLNEVSGWSSRQPDAPRWSYVLENDAPMGPKLLVSVAGAVITLSDPLSDEQPRRFVALEPASGSMRWEQTLPFAPSARGLLACRDHVFMHGYDTHSRSTQLVRLDPATGAPLSAIPAETGNASCTSEVILLASSDAVYSYGHDGTRRPDYPALESTLAVRDNQVYVHFFVSRSVQAFAWWDGTPVRERARFTPHNVPDSASFGQMRPGSLLVASTTPALVAIAPRDQAAGLWLVDCASQAVRWHGLADAEVVGIAATKHGLVVVARTGRQYSLRAVDEASGAVQQEIPTRLRVISALYELSNGFVCAGLGEAEWYVWEE
jgi:hypothetical protein